MQKKNDRQKLELEIQKLKRLLQQKVNKYNNFSHPEVVSISKILDKKINAFMKQLNNLDKRSPKK